jgi:hypothetical protein
MRSSTRTMRRVRPCGGVWAGRGCSNALLCIGRMRMWLRPRRGGPLGLIRAWESLVRAIAGRRSVLRPRSDLSSLVAMVTSHTARIPFRASIRDRGTDEIAACNVQRPGGCQRPPRRLASGFYGISSTLDSQTRVRIHSPPGSRGAIPPLEIVSGTVCTCMNDCRIYRS